MKFQYIEKFEDFIVKLIGLYKIKDDYVVSKSTGKKIEVKKKPLKVIREINHDKDVIVLNPLNEGLGDRPDTRWFYTAMAAGLYRRFVVFIEYLNTVKTLDDHGEDIDAKTLKILSKLCKNITDDIVKDVNKFDPIEFVNIFYDKRMKIARFRCAIYEESNKKKFKAKNLKVLKEIFNTILKVQDESIIKEKYRFKSDMMQCPKLHSILQVYYKVFSSINEFMMIIEDIDEDFVVDLTEFSAHLENLKEYYDKVKWIAQVSDTKEEKVVSSPLESTIPTTSVPTVVSSSIPAITDVRESSVPQVITPNQTGYFNMPNQQIVPDIIPQPNVNICNPIIPTYQPAVQSPLSFSGFGNIPNTTMF
jgi:hypothetical protein